MKLMFVHDRTKCNLRGQNLGYHYCDNQDIGIALNKPNKVELYDNDDKLVSSVTSDEFLEYFAKVFEEIRNKRNKN